VSMSPPSRRVRIEGRKRFGKKDYQLGPFGRFLQNGPEKRSGTKSALRELARPEEKRKKERPNGPTKKGTFGGGGPKGGLRDRI